MQLRQYLEYNRATDCIERQIAFFSAHRYWVFDPKRMPLSTIKVILKPSYKKTQKRELLLDSKFISRIDRRPAE